MWLMSRKCCISFLVLITFTDVTYAAANDTLMESRRHARVSGRIVKLYSGRKPDPILCLGEGFQKDAVDCSVFYRCLKASNGKYAVYRFQCGPGTIYDPETEICNHPKSTKRFECGGLFKDKPISSTDKFFENEIDGLHKENSEVPSPISTKVPISIASLSSTFQSSYMTNPHPTTTSNRGYQEFDVTSTALPWNLPTSLSTKNPRANIVSEVTYHMNNRPSSLTGNQCTSDGFMGDSEDCRKFYRCVNNQHGGYIQYEFLCSESTVWDDDTQGCNHPWAVQNRRCGKGVNFDENSVNYLHQMKDNDDIIPNKSIQQQTQISYGSKVTQLQMQVSNGATIQNQTQINFGDRLEQKNPSINQSQTQISYGSAVSQSQTQIDHSNKVTQTQLQVDHSNQSSHSQIQIAEFTSPSTTMLTSTRNTKGDSSNKCNKEGFMSDSNDCTKFYRCIRNEKGGFNRHEFSCSEGTLWDVNLEACNHAWAVTECETKTSRENINPTAPTILHTTNDYYTITTSHYFHNEIEKENGYENQNNQHEQKLTSSTQITNSLPIATSESLVVLETDCKSNGFFGNGNDCIKFYRCVENGRGGFTKYEYKCGEGTVWDPEIESCNHAWAVKQCSNRSQNVTSIVPTSTERAIITTVSLTQSTTQKNIHENVDESGYGSLQKETSPPSTTSTERIYSQRSDCTRAGFVGDKNDCKKFYRCVESGHGNFTRYEFTCGEGTVWDSKIESCNHVWAVETCGGIAINDSTANHATISHTVSDDNTMDDYGYTTHTNNVNNPPQTTTSSTTSTNIYGSTNKYNKCEKEGFMGDKDECKIFYRCVKNSNDDYIRYEFSCGDGTVWDPKISACNHAWAVENCGGAPSDSENMINPSTQDNQPTISNIDNDLSTKSTVQYPISTTSAMLTSTTSPVSSQCIAGGFISDKYDCKKFYRCVDDGKGSFIQYDFSCGEGTVWDQKIEACNHAWAVESCGSHLSPTSTASSSTASIPIKDDESDINYATQNNQDISSSTESHYSSSTSQLSTVPSDNKQCTSEGFVGDRHDCKKFYRCVQDNRGSFIRYEFTCGEGTIWDSEINGCNHANSVKVPCSSMSVHDTKEPEPGPNYTLPSSPIDNSDYSTTSKPAKSYQCEHEGFSGDKKDCKKFYRCVDNGTGGFHKYEFTCGDGTIWDQEILACNHASSDRQCNATDTESHTENNETSVSYSMSTPSSVTDPTEKTPMPSNNDQCTSEGFYPNSKDCKKFFRCVSDSKGSFMKYDFTCGDGTVWVQNIQACDHDSDESYCNKGTISGNPPFNSSLEQFVTTTSISVSSTTNKYTSTVADESGPQSSYKPTSSKDDVCQSDGFYPNNHDCKKFYQCANNGHGGYHKYEFTCSEGTAWDINTKSCNHISEVESCHSSNQIEVDTKTTMQDDTSPESSSTTESLPKSSTTTSATLQDNCVESGYFGNTKDCKKFYRCVDNGKSGYTKYDYTCGDGTIWDQDITACNHPQDVSNPSCKHAESSIATTTTKVTTPTTTMSHKPSETTTESTLSTDSSTQSTTTSSNHSTQEVSTTKPNNNNNNYTCTEAGFYPDPYDCKKFYRCVDWGGDGKSFSIFHFDCGEGTIWDPELQTCNHENSVYPSRNCSGTQSQNENINDTITTEGTTTKQEENTELTTTEGTSTSTTIHSSTQKLTTQQSPSTERTSTTQQSTTQQSTTEPSITQQSTTDQSTTQQSTATSKQSTAQQSSTTQQATTVEQTTSTATDQSTTTTTTTTTTTPTMTEQPTTITEETSMTSGQTTSDTTTAKPTTKAEETTTQESNTEQSSENNSSTTEQSSATTEQSSTTTEQSSTTTEQSSTTTEQSSTTIEQSSTTTEKSSTTTEQSSTTIEQSSTTTEKSSTTTEQTSTTQELTDGSTTTEIGQGTTTEKGSSDKECPQTDDDQHLYVCPTGFRRHPKYCNLFYQCTEDEDNHEVKVAVFNCPNNTIYDESKIQCIEEEKTDSKCDGQIAQKRRVKRLDAYYKEPITVSKGKYLCPTVGHFPFEKNEECSPVLFKCETTKTGKLRGLVYQCPDGYVYWTISRRCEPIAAMTTCKHSFSHWIGRYEIPTERKNVAGKKLN